MSPTSFYRKRLFYCPNCWIFLFKQFNKLYFKKLRLNNNLNIFVWGTFRSGDIFVWGHFGLGDILVGDILAGDILAGTILRGHYVREPFIYAIANTHVFTCSSSYTTGCSMKLRCYYYILRLWRNAYKAMPIVTAYFSVTVSLR